MISATASPTDSGAGTSRRSWVASAAGSPSSANRSQRIQALQEPVDRGRLQLVRDPVRYQARGALSDLLADDQPVLAQGVACRGQVDDPLDQARERRQLDRALDLPALRLTPGVEEVPRGALRVLARDPHHP